jgi:EH_Signature domain
MKSPSFSFDFSKKRQHPSSQLLELAKKLGNDDFTELNKLINIEPFQARSIDEILVDIESDRADSISALEWVYLIHTKEEWDREHLSKSVSTSKAIWQVAMSDSWLRQILCWQLGWHYGNYQQVLAPSLVECLAEFTPQIQKIKPLVGSIIQAISENQPVSKLAKIAHVHLLTPQQLLEKAQLPSEIAITIDALEYVATIFCQHPTIEQVDWLVKCLDKMMMEQQLKAVECILTEKKTKALGGTLTPLVEWLQRYYGPRTTGDLWHQLSDNAKQALRDWIGSVNYNDFANLISNLLDVLQVEDFERNQLRRRREFWAKYTNRFQRIRILVPQDSIDLCGDGFIADIEILKRDGSSPTEVCIFDFSSHFVVEFFRGVGSETRLFARTNEIEQQLFGSHKLSVKCLRRLGGEVHDHKYLWQFYCEQWLRGKGICLNPDTFPARKPEYHKELDREKGLARWRSEIIALEAEATASTDC